MQTTHLHENNIYNKNMDEFQENMLCERLDPEYVLYDSIHTKFKNRAKECFVIEIRKWLPEEIGW